MGWTLLLFTLKLIYCFQLILSSFKSLKPIIRRRTNQRTNNPPKTLNSADRNRRRGLKGQLMNWVVFVSYVAAERALEKSKLQNLIPLYDEIKLGMITTMLVWRVAGAGIVYAKFLQPLVRPYEPLLDWIGHITYELESILFWVLLLAPKWCIRKWNGTEAEEEVTTVELLPILESPKFKSMLKSPAPARVFVQAVEIESVKIRLDSNESRSASLAQFRGKPATVTTTNAIARPRRTKDLPEAIVESPIHLVLGAVVPEKRSERIERISKVKPVRRESRMEPEKIEVEKEIEVPIQMEDVVMELDLPEDIEMEFEDPVELAPAPPSPERILVAKSKALPRLVKPVPIIAPEQIVAATPIDSPPRLAALEIVPPTPNPPGHFSFPRLSSIEILPSITDSPKMKAQRALSELSRSSSGFEFLGKRAREEMERKKGRTNSVDLDFKGEKKISRTNSMMSVKSTGTIKEEGRLVKSSSSNSLKVVKKEVKKRVIKKEKEVLLSEEDSEEEDDRVYKKPIKRTLSGPPSSTAASKTTLTTSRSSRRIAEPVVEAIKPLRIRTISQKAKPLRIAEVEEVEELAEEAEVPKRRTRAAKR